MLELRITSKTDIRLQERMKIHYSQPKGFVGRSICYAVYYNNEYYGHIVGGSATRHLPGRNEYFNMTLSNLNLIVNNIFFNVSPIGEKYPIRNFTTKVVKLFCKQIKKDWFDKYGDHVVGVETLVEKPRTGELYLRAGFKLVGETKGYTCKRIAGKGSDSWTGKRVWDMTNLRPKIVLCKRI